MALADSNLVEVPDGTKSLAYTPIPREAVDAILAARNAESDEDLLDDKEEE